MFDGLDDVRRQPRELRRRLLLEDARRAVVELVVAERGRVQLPGVQTSIVGMSSSSAEFGGEAPTLSPPESSSDWPGSARGLLVEQRRELRRAADRRGDRVVEVERARVQLAVEVVEADHVDRREVTAVVEQVAPDGALRVLRLRDVEQERRRRREVDVADVLDLAALDRGAAGQERRAHVRVRAQVLHVRHVAVLAEERARRDQRARRGRVELVRRVGEDHEVARAGRVRHVGRRARPVRDVARLGLRVRAVDDLPVLRLAVVVPVVGVRERGERGADLLRPRVASLAGPPAGGARPAEPGRGPARLR